MTLVFFGGKSTFFFRVGNIPMKNWKHNTLESPEAAAGGVFCSKKEKKIKNGAKKTKKIIIIIIIIIIKRIYMTEPNPPDGGWVFVKLIYPRAQHTHTHNGAKME